MSPAAREGSSLSSIGLDDLLSGIIGALFIFVFTVLYTEIREARQRARDCAGMARLLLQEVERNEASLQVGAQKGQEDGREVTQEVLTARRENTPSIDSWRESRGRIAGLLKHADFEAIAAYYDVVQRLTDVLESVPATSSGTKQSVAFRTSEQSWQNRTVDVKDRLRRYAEPSRRRLWFGF